jgi:hypothetical protein
MDYKRIYNEFIENRKLKVIHGYSESHHILPRAMGGNNSKSNLIKLSAEDHFFAHVLLSKIDVRQKHALAMMMTGAKHLKGRKLRRHVGAARRVLGQPLLEETKKKMSDAHSKPEAKAKVSKQFKGITLSDEHKAKIKSGLANMDAAKRASMKEKMSKSRAGKPLSEEHKKNLSIANLSRNGKDELARREKISKSNFGKVRSEEVKKRSSEMRKANPLQREIAKKGRAALTLEMLSKGGKVAGKMVGSLPWWTNGLINKRCAEQPDKSFRRGMSRF